MKIEKNINVKGLCTREINVMIKKVIKNEHNSDVNIENIDKQNNIAVGLYENASIIIDNDVGDLVGALNDGAIIRVKGNADRYAADGMTEGEVIIEGNAGEGAGTAMSGGTLRIGKNAGNNLGQLLKGGTIIIGGDVGDQIGNFMINGKIIIGGNAGKELGGSMVGGVIYIRGNYESCDPNLTEEKLLEEEEEDLKDLFMKNQIPHSPLEFKKVVVKGKQFG
jgi:glutamate synthase domain-containing protein 3